MAGNREDDADRPEGADEPDRTDATAAQPDAGAGGPAAARGESQVDLERAVAEWAGDDDERERARAAAAWLRDADRGAADREAFVEREGETYRWDESEEQSE